MNLKSLFVGVSVAAALLVSSCSTPKDITYMQGVEDGQTQAVKVERRLTIQPDDRLAIVVTSKDPALAEVFNLSVSQYRIGMSTANTSDSRTAAFTVAPDGTIEYPILGALQVAGLSRKQVASLIQHELIERNLLKDPTVTVEFLNATVAVLGDVKTPGEYTIDRDNLTILQALSKAGDLNITGMRQNVLVMREVDGKDMAYRLDLTNVESLMSSPAYYVQQNDVIYVEPNSMRKRQATESGNTVLTPSFWISVGSLLTTITALIIR